MTDPNARWRREARRDGFDTMTMERQHRLFRLRFFRLLRLIAREAGWTRERCQAAGARLLAAKRRRDHV